MKSILESYKIDLSDAIKNIDIDTINNIANELVNVMNNGKNIYVFGNGGSGSTASHMVCDIIKGCSFDKKNKYKIICLNDNVPTILAYSNDVNYDIIFEQKLINFLNDGDAIIGISGSGNSTNVLKAFEYAKSKNVSKISFTGFDGGKLLNLSDISFNVPVYDMQIVEDLHLTCIHMIYKLLNL